MPGADEANVLMMLQTIQELFNIDNQYYSSHPISIAIGHATTKDNEQVEDMLKRADHHMYQRKKSISRNITAIKNRHIACFLFKLAFTH